MLRNILKDASWDKRRQKYDNNGSSTGSPSGLCGKSDAELQRSSSLTLFYSEQPSAVRSSGLKQDQKKKKHVRLPFTNSDTVASQNSRGTSFLRCCLLDQPLEVKKTDFFHRSDEK